MAQGIEINWQEYSKFDRVLQIILSCQQLWIDSGAPFITIIIKIWLGFYTIIPATAINL